MSLINKITRTVKNWKNKARIAFPETEDSRVIKAAIQIKKKKIAEPILIKNLDLEKSEEYSQKLFELRKEKGLALDQARELLKNKIYYAVMMVYCRDADAVISGSLSPTSDTVRPALQILKQGYASSFFIMEKGKRVFFFADCALNPDPNSEQLAKIALDTSESAKRFGIKPRVALLSFSTKGSGEHELVKKVQDAVSIVRKINNNNIHSIDGELQLDAAIVKEVAKLKAPESEIAGNANVLIFPDLNSGNIGYKLVQRFGDYKAIGPVIQGLKNPVNDLSRGCSVQDIIDLAAVTSLQVHFTDVQKKGKW